MLRAVQIAGYPSYHRSRGQGHQDAPAQCLRARAPRMRLPSALEPGPGLQRLHEQGHLLLQAVEATLPPCGPGGQSVKPEGYY